MIKTNLTHHHHDYSAGAKETTTQKAIEVVEGPSEVAAQVVDQCSTGSHDCSSNATCISLKGSYECTCNLGFEGDGRVCVGMRYFACW